MRVRIVVADDHPVVRVGLRNIVAARHEYEVVGEAVNGAEAIAQVRSCLPDILLLDLDMPGMPGLDALRDVVSTGAGTRVIMVTGRIEAADIVRALQLGARGIVLKDAAPDQIHHAIDAVMHGRYWVGDAPVENIFEALEALTTADTAPRQTFGLTPRELQIVEAVVEGCTNQLIADRFRISEDTVKRHLTHVFDKLGVSNRLELALFAINRHVISHH